MKKFLLKTHRIFGLIFLPIMLVWFISGFFMIIGGFPHASSSWTKKRGPMIPKEIQPHLEGQYTSKKITYCAFGWKEITEYKSSSRDTVFLKKILLEPSVACDRYAALLMEKTPVKKKLLNDLDTWIPWSHKRPLLPIYKYYFEDGTQLYISSVNGEVVQKTTPKQRWVAYFGAIPHWLYFKSLREHTSTWVNVIKILCLFSLLAAITGYIYGWMVFFKAKKRNPYKKKAHRYHFFFGMAFGLVVITWILSGFFSLHHVSNRFAPKGIKTDVASLWQPAPWIDNNQKIFPSSLDGIVAMEWKNVGGTALLKISSKDGSHRIITASGQNHIWDEAFVCSRFKELAPKWKYALTKQDDHTITIKANDPSDSSFVLDLKEGKVLRYLDNEKRLNNFLYRGLHSFKIGSLKSIPWLRNSLLIIFLSFGTIMLFSGLWITIKKRY